VFDDRHNTFGSAIKVKKSVRVVEIEMDHTNILPTQVLDASTLGKSPDGKLNKALSEVKQILRGPIVQNLKSPVSKGFITDRSANKKETPLIDATLGLRLKLSPKIEPKFKAAKLKNKVE
jgi:hypothetical protein